MIEFPFENISDSVFHHAARRPDAPALIDGRETLSYGVLATLVGQAAVYLGTRRVKAGDRIGIAMTNSIERVIVSLAAMRIGAVVIELPTDITAPALGSQVSRFGMAATVVEAGGPGSPAPIALTIDLNWRGNLARFSGDARCDGDPDGLRLIILSSGSTGVPKGIMTTHRQRIFRAGVYASATGFYMRDDPGTLLLAAPASTSFVSQFLTTQLMLGGPVVLLPVFKYLLDLVRELIACDNAIFPVPPGLGRSFFTYAEQPGRLFPKMRALVIGGQPLAGPDKLLMVERLTPNLYEIYGCAGFGMISCIGPAEISKQLNSVGRPASLPGVDIEIAGPDGAPVRDGGIGELRLRGPSAAAGFYHAEDNDRGTERFAGGWYYPGEVASINKAGYLILEGRTADAIKLGALTVYPSEIENVITQHPQVAEAAVVGRPGARGVDELFAFVVARPGSRQQDIDAYCRAKLPAGKRPKYIYYVDSLPRTEGGKINRPALKAGR